MNRLRDVVGDEGEVSTARVWTAPSWDSSRSRYAGHRAQTTVSVESPASLASKVAQAAMSSGGVQLRGPYFAVSNEEAIREELLAEAVSAARRKAKRLAEAAERTSGRVLAVREEGAESYRSEIYDRAMTLSDSASVEPAIVAGESTISAEVVVSVELID
jgi:uncharacterized protein YggE